MASAGGSRITEADVELSPKVRGVLAAAAQLSRSQGERGALPLRCAEATDTGTTDQGEANSFVAVALEDSLLLWDPRGALPRRTLALVVLHLYSLLDLPLASLALQHSVSTYTCRRQLRQ